MAAALSIGEYNQLYLKHLFLNSPGTPIHMKAAQAILDEVPEFLVFDGKKHRHWVSLFDTNEMKFAYYNASLRSLRYLSRKEIKQQIETP